MLLQTEDDMTIYVTADTHYGNVNVRSSAIVHLPLAEESTKN